MARVAILTSFQKLDPWYSLTGIVRDQAEMLVEYGNEVHLFVSNNFKPNPDDVAVNANVLPILPYANLHDYGNDEPLSPEHEAVARDTAAMLEQTLSSLKIEVVFTHDLVFTGWNKPYAVGIQMLKDKLPGVSWFHWVHSVPSQFRDWWYMAYYGPNHKIVYPNKTDLLRVAENFRAPHHAVIAVPHIKDLRTMFDFEPATRELIDCYPALMKSNVVNIYPASSDRFESKGLTDVIKIMGYIKSLGIPVCLFVANQWATTADHYADLMEYYELGAKYGLTPGADFIFSSFHRSALGDQSADYSGHRSGQDCRGYMDGAGYPYRIGVPRKILFQLMQLANLFIFPTTHETFGLVLPEVSLASGALCVLNRSLDMMSEVSGGNTLFIDFGSITHEFNIDGRDEYLKQVALVIMQRIHMNDSLLTRSFMRRHYNYDTMYAKYYAPMIAEARMNAYAMDGVTLH